MTRDFDPLFYPFYGMLTKREQALYRDILPGIRAAQENIKPTVSATTEESFHVMQAIANDRPEIFWINGGACEARSRNDVVVSVLPVYNQYRSDLPARQARFRKAVLSYLSLVKGKKPYEQELILHDRLVRDISYVSHSLDQTAYAALVERKAVCAGYAKAFQFLMQELGIPCYSCSGVAISRKSTTWENHAWNMIRLGSDFYNIDITWDDSFDSSEKDFVTHTYFNCTDSQIRQNHRRDTPFDKLPACNGTKFSFTNISGVTSDLELVYQDGVTYRTPVRSQADFCNLVESALRKNKSRKVQFSFPVKGSALQKNSMKLFQDVIGKVYPRKGYSINVRTVDYKNGWYKLELILELT